MEEAKASASTTDSGPHSVLIHVLSPSTEVPDRLTFPNVPVTTTMAEMKSKIQEAVATKPTPERQRLIYRGQALRQQDMTLATLFGSDVSSNTEGFNLHLVLSPPGVDANNANPLREHAQNPRLNFPQPIGLPRLPLGQNPWPQRPASTSQLPVAGHPAWNSNQQNTQTPNAQQPQVPMQFPQGPLPGPVPRSAWNAPPNFNVPPNSMFGGPPLNMPLPGVPLPWQYDQHWPPPQANPNNPYTHHLNPELNRSAANQPEASQETAEQTTATLAGATPQNSQNGQNAPGSTYGPRTPHGQTPLGQWRISINQTTYHTPNHLQNNPIPSVPLGQGNGASLFPNSQRAPLAGISDANLRSQLQQLRNYANSLAASQRNPSPPSTMAYLLSSPTGPQALLISPAGHFATAGYRASVPNIPLLPIPPRAQPHPSFGQTQHVAHQTQNPNPQQEPVQPPIGNGQQEQQPNLQPQAQQQDQAGELLRIILPLGGHLWLLIRLLGFVYLFSSGNGWRNTILLGIGAFVVFAIQTRMLEPILQYVWTPIRRHVEALVQVEQQAPAPRDQQAAPGSETGNPSSPQSMANRLVQERRNRQNHGPFRQAIAQLERSLALFLASLVPGVGERHVAAREQAVRQRREQEETARREEEEQQRQEQVSQNNSKETDTNRGENITTQAASS